MSIRFANTCHLWQVDLKGPTTQINLLDAAELARAARLRFSRDRARFVTGRVALRRILGALLDRDPGEIHFDVGEHGRPSIADAGRLEFNISHSGDLALIGVSAPGPLGVDIEVLREVERAVELARRYLHPDELSLIEQAATPKERSTAWLTCWTRKEAVLKSIGAGLTRDTRQIFVGAAAEDKMLDVPAFPPLRLFSLTPAEGYIAAIATAPLVCTFELHYFNP